MIDRIEELEAENTKLRAIIAAQSKGLAHDDKAFEKLEAERDRMKTDAFAMACRLYGEDDSTFSPECYDAMRTWRPVIEQALRGGEEK